MPNANKFQYYYGRLTYDQQEEATVFALGQEKENFGVHGQKKTSFNPQSSFSSRQLDKDPPPYPTVAERDAMVAYIRKRFSKK